MMETNTPATNHSGAGRFDVILSNIFCLLGLPLAYAVSQNQRFQIDLVADPAQTLRLYFIIQAPIVILVFSRFRRDPENCPFFRAAARGVLGILAGAVINALGAICLGAPVGTQYLQKTAYWSLLMSVFTFVPAVCVFGASWKDWQRLFAHTKPADRVDYMICVPAHGAIVGSWFGAWPMPLDWERPWQEWPICVSYGTMIGYTVGLLFSFAIAFRKGVKQHVKGD